MDDVRFVELTDARVRVRVRGDGPSVVFAADPPNVVEHYHALLNAFAPRFRTVVFEATGFGLSTGRAFALDAEARAVVGLLERLGGGPHVLAFPCVAAYVALRVAETRPDLVRALVLSQAPSWEDEARWARRVDPRGLLRTPVVGQALLALAKRRVARAWYGAATPRPGRFQETADRAFDRGARFPLASAFQAFFRGPPPEFRPIDVPAALVWGDADRTHRRSDPDGLRTLLPRARVVRLDDVGHFPELEAPERFRDVVASLVADPSRAQR